ncbi:MAG: hypothetical protein ACRCXB_28600 [Aeromonadaceae bacterium]
MHKKSELVSTENGVMLPSTEMVIAMRNRGLMIRQIAAWMGVSLGTVSAINSRYIQRGAITRRRAGFGAATYRATSSATGDGFEFTGERAIEAAGFSPRSVRRAASTGGAHSGFHWIKVGL